MFKRILILVIVLLSLTVTAFARYIVGDTVANFTLPDSGGNPVSLYDYSDNIVLIYFWAST